MDNIQRFIFENTHIRGEIAHLTDTYTTIMKQRPYPEAVRQILGEALVSCLLLMGTIKFEGRLSLQFQGDERFPLLLIQCDNDLNLRGYAKYHEDLPTEEYQASFQNGQMILTIEQYQQTQIHQSIVPISSYSMSKNLMDYFAQSEQITTCVWLAVGEHSAAGMLLQLLPGQNSQEREEFWEYATVIGNTITQDELLRLDNETLLYRLYHADELRVFAPKPARFLCSCSLEKMKQVLKVFGEPEIKKMLSEQEKIEVSCDFCGNHYSFDAIDLALLFR